MLKSLIFISKFGKFVSLVQEEYSKCTFVSFVHVFNILDSSATFKTTENERFAHLCSFLVNYSLNECSWIKAWCFQIWRKVLRPDLMFHSNQCCESVERSNSTFRASNLQVILLTKESRSALDGKRPRLYFETETYRITRRKRRTSNPRTQTKSRHKVTGHAIFNDQVKLTN